MKTLRSCLEVVPSDGASEFSCFFLVEPKMPLFHVIAEHVAQETIPFMS